MDFAYSVKVEQNQAEESLFGKLTTSQRKKNNKRVVDYVGYLDTGIGIGETMIGVKVPRVDPDFEYASANSGSQTQIIVHDPAPNQEQQGEDYFQYVIDVADAETQTPLSVFDAIKLQQTELRELRNGMTQILRGVKEMKDALGIEPTPPISLPLTTEPDDDLVQQLASRFRKDALRKTSDSERKKLFSKYFSDEFFNGISKKDCLTLPAVLLLIDIWGLGSQTLVEKFIMQAHDRKRCEKYRRKKRQEA